jgi:hypothetical protein
MVVIPGADNALGDNHHEPVCCENQNIVDQKVQTKIQE